MSDTIDSESIDEVRSEPVELPNRRPQHKHAPHDNSELIEVAELLFFAYRDFTADPDAILSEFGFGRAHHRVLHFVYRHPGIRVADLLEILKITKQSLARVLKQLVDNGYIEQKEGSTDRRERRLYVSSSGTKLTEQLMSPQLKRISQALEKIGPDNEDAVKDFLYTMVGDSDRSQLTTLLRASADRNKSDLEA